MSTEALTVERLAADPALLPFMVRRLANVYDLSDEFLLHVLNAHGNDIQTMAGALARGVEDVNLSELRIGGDTVLADEGARRLGFGSSVEMQAFMTAHPMLSERMHATRLSDAAMHGWDVEVLATSSTEVIVRGVNAPDDLLRRLDRAKLIETEAGAGLLSRMTPGNAIRIQGMDWTSIKVSPAQIDAPNHQDRPRSA